MAGIVSLANYHRVKAGKSQLGFLNPFLYGYASSFVNDITTGNNFCYDTKYSPVSKNYTAQCCTNYGYYCNTGWDPVTGLGSVNVGKFISAAMGLPSTTFSPTLIPTVMPSTATPSASLKPSEVPTKQPTISPTSTTMPSVLPTKAPTRSPAASLDPTALPTMRPSVSPTFTTTRNPTMQPTPAGSTLLPSAIPSALSSSAPSNTPLVQFAANQVNEKL